MKLKERVIKMIVGVEKLLCPQYCGVVDRRRVIAFLLLTLCELILIPFHLVLFLCIGEPWGLSLTCLHLLLLLALQYAIWKRKLVFVKGISCLYLLLFMKLAFDSVLCTLFGYADDNLSVMSNVFIMYILAITALSQLLYKTSVTISIGIIPVIIMFFWDNSFLFSMFSIKAFFVGFMMLLYVSLYNMSIVTKGLRQPRRVTMVEQKALNMLADLKEGEEDVATNLLERLTPDLRQNIMSHASEHLRKEEMEKLAWDKVCEDLTNSEKEICKLILQGKTLKEICIHLNKSESNITSQRCHIRKKLNMDRKEDLKRTLEKRFFEAREKIEG